MCPVLGAKSECKFLYLLESCYCSCLVRVPHWAGIATQGESKHRKCIVASVWVWMCVGRIVCT